MSLLQKTIESIAPVDKAALAAAWRHIDALAKPVGSLGLLEHMAARLAAIAGEDFDLGAGEVLVFCADNGVCGEGVSSCPQDVTRQVTVNLTRGLTGVCVLARSVGASVTPVDLGVKNLPPHAGVLHHKLMSEGTGNIAREAAMGRDTAVAALEAGIACVRELHARGAGLFAIGEMGIGNTTTAAAVLSALAALPPERTVGRGAGLDDVQLENKRRVVQMALDLHRPDAGDPIDVLAKVGGLDIAAMAGACLGAAALRRPMVLDGYISCVAGLCARRLCPAAADYLFASHVSEEPGAVHALSELGLEAPLRMHMRLGEGSGAVLLFPILRAAQTMYRQMGTFEQANISEGEYLDKWQSHT